MDDREWRAFQRVAKRQGMTLSEWARQALRRTRTAMAEGAVDAKLRAIRNAVRLSQAPAPDIEEMLEETERGFLGDTFRGAEL